MSFSAQHLRALQRYQYSDCLKQIKKKKERIQKSQTHLCTQKKIFVKECFSGIFANCPLNQLRSNWIEVQTRSSPNTVIPIEAPAAPMKLPRQHCRALEAWGHVIITSIVWLQLALTVTPDIASTKGGVLGLCWTITAFLPRGVEESTRTTVDLYCLHLPNIVVVWKMSVCSWRWLGRPKFVVRTK